MPIEALVLKKGKRFARKGARWGCLEAQVAEECPNWRIKKAYGAKKYEGNL